MRRFLKILLFRILSDTKIGRKVNRRILNFSLRTIGYNNFHDMRVSGEVNFVRTFLTTLKPKLCLDIGANRGEYSDLILRHTRSHVIAFEPLPILHDVLEKNLSKFNGRARIEQLAVSNVNGIGTLSYSEKEMSAASLWEDVNQVNFVSNKREIQVETITLDDFCSRENIPEIDFIKIDTEGFELEVIEGVSKFANNKQVKIIQIEYNIHNLHRGITLMSFAKMLPGFDVCILRPNGISKVDPEDWLFNIYIFSNFLFIRNDLSQKLHQAGLIQGD